jgi:hypothetical protein
MTNKLLPTMLLGALALAAATTASAADGQRPQVQHAPSAQHAPSVQHRDAGPRSYRGPVHLDQRYRHDHYYPSVGFAFGALPSGAISIGYGPANWFFHGGVWFRSHGSRYVVAVPPPGLLLPYLPPAYVTLWSDGVPYYYANGVYYVAGPQGYVVAAPPAALQAARPIATAPSFVIYPRNGQGSAQIEADRQACNDWGNAQAGGSGDATVFQRAFEACMDGRGYSVR